MPRRRNWRSCRESKVYLSFMCDFFLHVPDLTARTEKKRLEEEEEAAASKASKAPAKKLTQFEIQQSIAAAPAPKAKGKPAKDADIEKNINHVIRETDEQFKAAGIEKHVASGVGEATELLRNLTAGGGDSPDAHPERRRKAAFKVLSHIRTMMSASLNLELRLTSAIGSRMRTGKSHELGRRILALSCRKSKRSSSKM
jgi:hypothetical protein